MLHEGENWEICRSNCKQSILKDEGSTRFKC